MKVENDHRSEFSNLSNWKEEASLKKIRASTGFEPVTSAIPVRCSTNWAMKPHIGSEVNLLSSYLMNYFIYTLHHFIPHGTIWTQQIGGGGGMEGDLPARDIYETLEWVSVEIGMQTHSNCMKQKKKTFTTPTF